MKKVKKNLVARTVIIILLVFIAAVSVYWTKTQKEKPACSRCNVVLIDIDILRADALPCYGYKRNTTPNICALAQKSQVFTDNYAQANWTLPSMMSTITSLYPFSHGVSKTYSDALNPDTPTLAAELKKIGYNTIFFGSISSSTIDDTNGGTKGYSALHGFGPRRWLEEVREVLNQKGPFFIHLYTGNLHMPYLVENESQILEQLPRPNNFPATLKDFKPLVGKSLYQNYLDVFTSLAISERPDLFASMSASKIPGLVDYFWSRAIPNDPERIINNGWIVKYEAYMEAITKNEPLSDPYTRLLYDSVLSVLDNDLSPLLSLINSPGFEKNTIVILYSDHGEAFGEHGINGHPESLYNEIIKTPLIVYVPGVSPQRFTVSSQNIDILPTILGLVGGTPLGGLRGESLVSLMTKGAPIQKRPIVAQAGKYKFSIYNGTLKLIVNNYNNPLLNAELYNTQQDPGETTNIISFNQRAAEMLLSGLTATILEKTP